MLFAPRSRTIDVYSSPTTHFVIGAVGSGLFRVLFFERSTSASKLSDILFADPKLYDRRRLARLLRSAVPRTTSERRRGRGEDLDAEDDTTEAYRRQVPVHQFRAAALLGVFRFLKGYFLLFVTERKRAGYINGHVVYSIASVKLLPITASHVATTTGTSGIPASTASSVEDDSAASGSRSRGWSWLGSNRDPIDELEARYLSLFQLIDLTKGDFFFSYTLDLTNYLQSTFEREPVDDTFAWNDYLTMELRETIIYDEQQRLARQRPEIPPELAKKLLWTSDSWLVPLIHGSFQQQRFSVLGKSLSITLIGRRSRYNAGTRYLKRGVNEQGKVANHVEVEQIVELEGIALSSFVQVRGSIPTYWTQDTSAVTPKPPIKRYRSDPTFLATRMHFSELMMRYGEPIIVLNLVRRAEYEKSQREAKLGEEFADAVELLNCSLSSEEKIVYDAIDFKRLSKVGSISTVLDEIARKDLEVVNVFATDPMGGTNWSYQKGTVRTNCIDCLDRTNVGQFCVGLCALGIQLEKLNVTLPLSKSGGLTGPFLDVFVEMFESLGDRIAQQYGGSQAHKKGGVAPTSELLTSIRRYYNNSFNDRPKQDAINLFLGCFVPRKVHLDANGKLIVQEQPSNNGDSAPINNAHKALWDMDNDFYLHNFRVTDRGTFSLRTDPGTVRWWFGKGADKRRVQRPRLASAPSSLQSVNETASSSLALVPFGPVRTPSPVALSSHILRPPLTDEEDSGVFVQFERVLGDGFFKPVPVGAGGDEKANSIVHRSLRDRLFHEGKSTLLNESGISSTAGPTSSQHPASASDDEDEPFSTNANQRTGRLGSIQDPLQQFVPAGAGGGASASAPNSLLMSSSAIQSQGLTTFLEEDEDSSSASTASTPGPLGLDLTAALLNRRKAKGLTDAETFDFMGSALGHLSESNCPDLSLFRQQEHIAHHTEDAFSERPVDPALLDYMQDFIVSGTDMEGIRRVMVDSNAVTNVIPNGPFKGFKRGQIVSELYSAKPDSGAVFSFEAETEATKQETKRERDIFAEYLMHATL